MQKDIVIIDPHIRQETWVESYVTFRIFTTFIQNKIREGGGIKLQHYKSVLDKLSQYPELQGDVPVKDMNKYEDVLEAISLVLFPVMEDENEYYWCLGNAMTPEIFFGSNAFYNLLTPTSEMFIGDSFITREESSTLQKELSYQVILEQLYQYNVGQNKEWIHGFINEITGLYKYYRINIDKRFSEVKPKVALPQLGKFEIQACLASTDGYGELGKKIPIQDFIATGFTILTLTDVTSKHALEQISHAVVSINDENGVSVFMHITRLLKTVIGNQQYDFGIMPILTINNRPGLLYENFPFSILIKTCLEQGVPKRDFTHFINDFLKDPTMVTWYPGRQSNVFPEIICNAIAAADIQFYSFIPVFNKEQLVGLFEISTNGTEILSEHFLRNTLRPVFPYISKLFEHFIDAVAIKVEAIIKDKFTTLQPSVQWKFNEVAWHYFRNNFIENKKTPVENISFTDVYPLYGAIDIRNSTIERNKALRKDLLVQLNCLREIFVAIENNMANHVKSYLISCDYWLYHLSDFISIDQELQLNDFLENDVNRYLAKYQNNKSYSLDERIQEYRNAIEEEKGIAFLERRKLEASIQTINNSVGQYFDLFKVELQSVFPCYFEKIRTDGVEYDIYIGQSIAPKNPFDSAYLQKLRLLQLQSMAAISRLTHSLLPHLLYELHTTQLIFVHSRPIDISFRNDERRFDVEGAYNIRYHIIKKRIDKVHVRSTGERLTQVGKIALVYYNEKDALDYNGYILQLQATGFLLDDLEHLELEELQGVSGLKALRVGVKYE